MLRRSPALTLAFSLAAATLPGGSVGVSRGQGQPPREVDPAATDEARLQGIWVMAESVYNGVRADERQLQGWLLVVEGNVYNPGHEEVSIEYTFRIDPTLTPKAIDLTPLRGLDGGRTYRGIYSIEGDVLTVCRPIDAAADRPAGFVVRPGSNLTRIVWKRRPVPESPRPGGGGGMSRGRRAALPDALAGATAW